MSDQDFTVREVPRSSGRDVLDTIATHRQDGRIGLCDVLFDGTRVEAIALVNPVDPTDPDSEIDVIPIAIVIDDDLYAQMTLADPDPVDDSGVPEETEDG